jgi:hypothetical protein
VNVLSQLTNNGRLQPRIADPKFKMIEATLTLALQREDLRDEVRAMATRLLGEG